MTEIAARPTTRFPWIAALALAGTLVGVTLALWAHYGSTVFYEMILAGLAACF
jgi:hypothetical protein